jgi:enoyl-CoA hydratase
MSESTRKLRFFTLETDADGVTLITFHRPPVNAFSSETYQEICDLVDLIQSDDTTRVAVLTSPHESRAWGGGADLNDFVGLDYESRLKRYELVNRTFETFFRLDRPIIAAVNNHAIGAGFVLSTLCDVRVASKDAFFALPEIDRGVLANGGGFFFRLRMPQGFIREMILTGRRFMAEELRYANVFNYILPKDEVLPKALEIAHLMARKSLPALKANKAAVNIGETQTYWLETYKMTQQTSATLTAGADAKEGIKAFLEKRDPVYVDR